MSKISLQPNASGAGTFSIVAPDSNTNRTLTLPDEEGTVATIENIPPGYEDQDALDLFNVSGSAPVFACRAWVNFDGTGTVSIRASGNVSSITDRGVGLYTVNMAVAMPDTNYISTGTQWSLNQTTPNQCILYESSSDAQRTTNSFRVDTVIGNSAAHSDTHGVLIAIFR